MLTDETTDTTNSNWVAELEPGLWISDWGVTKRLGFARQFGSWAGTKTAIRYAREKQGKAFPEATPRRVNVTVCYQIEGVPANDSNR